MSELLPSVNQYFWFVLLIGVAAAVAVGTGLWLLLNSFRGRMDDDAYRRQLEELASGMSDEEELARMDRGRNYVERWTLYWQKVAKSSGIPLYAEKNNSAPRDVFFLAIGIFIVVNLLLKNPVSGPLVGLVVSVIGVYCVSVFLKMKYNNEIAKINDQLPGFLFAMKANLQANETPVRALLKIVDNMPDPLRSDLIIVKQKLLANATFSEALDAMVLKTTSSELKFLGSCLIQAAESGASIEPQIDIIKDVLEQRKAAAAELRKAVKATLPSLYIGTFAIPGSLMATYLLDENSRNFWFADILSWLALIVVGALWATGMFFTRRMVENIKNL